MKKNNTMRLIIKILKRIEFNQKLCTDNKIINRIKNKIVVIIELKFIIYFLIE